MRFRIVAYQQQQVVTLALDAASFDDARAQARERGVDIVSIRQQWHWFAQRRRKEPPLDLVLFSQELRSLLDAGLSLIEALLTLSRKELNGTRRQLIDVLIRQLREGKPFSTALREFPAIFPPLYIALAAASEQTGDLGGSLGRFIAYRTQMDQARKRVVSAAIYPALLLGVGGLVVVFLMTYVVPRFSRIYEEFGSNLPLMSRLLMEWGGLLDAYGLEILLGVVFFAMLVTYLVRQTRHRQGVLHWLLGLKWLHGLRSRFRIYALARFFRTLGLLQREGIPITTALGLARELLDEDGRVALDHVVVDIRAGVALSGAMEKHDLAPPVAAELLKVGEKAGNVGEKMIRIADFYDEEIARWSEWFLKLFEPLLMLTIGLFIAFIVVLLYLPIFELAGTL
ncbi:MAG TPA: type II secretion system F family protein [Azonexus sp.]|nr:type II secretion system F family protein [Azonexus sp.]